MAIRDGKLREQIRAAIDAPKHAVTVALLALGVAFLALLAAIVRPGTGA